MTTSIPQTMKSARCHGVGQALVVEEVPVPTPGPGQVLVKLESCGVCHSDLHLRDDGGLPDELYPLVVGHEGIGRIAALGEGARADLSIGMRIGLPWLYDSCLECKECMTGHENFCGVQTARGIEHHGAFAEYALIESAFACEIPDGIDVVKGAPLLCAGLTAWVALERANTKPGSNVLIVGAGGLGQYAILIAKARGAQVFVIDQDDAKLETAKKLGADAAIKAGPEAGQKVKELGGADVTLNFAPTPHVWDTIKDAVNLRSHIVAVALVNDPVDLSMYWLIEGGHKVMGSSVGTRQDLRDFLAFAARNPMGVEVEVVSLEQANDALDRLKRGEVQGRICVDFSL
ncbi:alcohol dehydrogenase catalytic domain-containing protein [Ruegeria halocynthiae]|uniref:alcohol dehydrogenase catalytic domain-containing protein n=1 Tax=Ruegeria halocynthiae TaxID=985054 RepID=UPI0009DE53C6|nr:alcohol dehydrogenase catalytic domain-containing protein [Ruegeria halocynthiae]